MDRQNAFREQEMNMGIKVKKILTGTAPVSYTHLTLPTKA